MGAQGRCQSALGPLKGQEAAGWHGLCALVGRLEDGRRAVQVVSRDEVRRLQAQGAAVVEVLPNEEYELEHIAGAVNLPLKELDRSVLERFPTDRVLVVYCNDAL